VFGYEYTDRNGAVVARKVRATDKRFYLQRPDTKAPDGWRNGLDGVAATLGPYRLPALVGASLVFIVEGEKAADVFAQHELVATCGPFGASGWKAAWSDTLLECVVREALIVILPDNDRAGDRHAELVAAKLLEHAGVRAVVIKVVPLPGLPPHGDVFDFLEVGGTAADLQQLVSAAAPWSPMLAADRRAQASRDRRAARQRARRQAKRAERSVIAASRPIGATHPRGAQGRARRTATRRWCSEWIAT
jgi:putative DNA primase/helicase